MSDALGRYPVSVEIPVAWGDMDALRHVNNSVYLRWFETARMAYFAHIGFSDLEEVGPILARAAVDYRRPVTYPDTVRVDITVSRIGGSSFVMACRMWSRAQQAEVATGESVMVAYDYRAGRSTPVDDRLRAAIVAVEAQGR
jgi:acyl-CoA thioester hydrolase